MKYVYLILLSSLFAAYNLNAMEEGVSQTYESLKEELGYDPKVMIFKENTLVASQGLCFDEPIKKCSRIVGFHHGFGDEGDSVLNVNDKLFKGDYWYTFSFPDSKGFGEINREQANLAQHKDVNVAAKVAEYINDLYEPENIDLYGVSRGGGVVLGLLGRKENDEYVYLNPEIREKIKIAILDAPLVSVPEVVDHVVSGIVDIPGRTISQTLENYTPTILKGVSKMPIIKQAIEINYFFTSFRKNSTKTGGACVAKRLALPYVIPDYDQKSFTPFECIKNIDPTLKLFMYTTGEDFLIGPQTIRNITKERLRHNSLTKENTFAWIAEKGSHIEGLDIEPDIICGAFNELLDITSDSEKATLNLFSKIPNEVIEELEQEQHKDGNDNSTDFSSAVFREGL